MRGVDFWRFVFSALRASPLRTMLTVLGVAIGIFTVTLLTSLGEGLKGYVLDSFSQFGSRIVAVNPGKSLTSGMGGILSSSRPLTLEDAQALARLPFSEAMIPVIQGAGELQWGKYTRATDILGTGYQLPEIWQFELAQGQFLPAGAAGRSRPYVVLGSSLSQALFSGQNPIGERVRIGGMGFRVMGVMASKGQLLGFDLDEVAYIPVDLAQQLFNREGLMEIDLLFSAATTSEQFSKRIKKTLIERHGREDFTLTSQDEMLASLDRILGLLTLGVAALGMISLVVGGVGIVTIMSTGVHERRAEIGLLGALGANSGVLQRIFLAEALLLGGLGGFLGLLLLLMTWMLLGWVLPGLPLILQPVYLAAALLLSLLVGAVSGWGPARSAASIDPVQVLRDL